MSVRTSLDWHALRTMRRMRARFVRLGDREAAEGSGVLSATYDALIEELDKRIARLEAP